MLNLNDALYYVEVNNSSFSRKRIEYVDAQGVVWHRYDKPKQSYGIKLYRIVGRSVVITTWVDSPLEVDIPEDLYYLENGEEVAVNDVDNNYSWYSTKERAEARIASYKEQTNE